MNSISPAHMITPARKAQAWAYATGPQPSQTNPRPVLKSGRLHPPTHLGEFQWRRTRRGGGGTETEAKATRGRREEGNEATAADAAGVGGRLFASSGRLHWRRRRW
ncbi:hypothetical protein Tsubulata_013687, partial [Turnera subulata]